MSRFIVRTMCTLDEDITLVQRCSFRGRSGKLTSDTDSRRLVTSSSGARVVLIDWTMNALHA